MRSGADLARGPTHRNDVQGMLDFAFQAYVLMLGDTNKSEQEIVDVLDGPHWFASGLPGADVNLRA